jgi:two-component system response regulator HydG
MTTTTRATILIVDDEATIVEALETVLQKEGYEVLTASHGRAALDIIRRQVVHVMISDLRMPGQSGEDLLKAARTLIPEIAVIVMTAYGTVENAVEAMKLGAFDFISKPLKRATVVAAVQRAVERSVLVAENRELKAKLAAATSRRIIGSSQVMRATLEIARQAANSSATVLLLGESGTGKELLARYVHENSPRAKQAFVATNCAALPESLLESELFGHEKGAFTGAIRARAGRFVEANGGSLFLDEIGEIPPQIQVKLLRALQEGEVEPVGGRLVSTDFRLICATNRELQEDVRAGRFRDDLYYRINVVPIRVPPLRDRLEDVPLLAEHFLRMFVARHGKAIEGFSPEALERMMSYSWPGNVRELENAVERAVVLARQPLLGLNDLPAELREPGAGQGRQLTFSIGMPLEEVERRMIMETLQYTGGDKRLAADLLGIATRTIYRKIEAPNSRETAPREAAPREQPAPDAKPGDKGIFH